jgi:glycosyltransferase involved in cell wall biosynthesis
MRRTLPANLDLDHNRRTARSGTATPSTAVKIVGDFENKTGMRTTAARYMRALQSIVGVTVTAIDSSERAPSRGHADVNVICCDVASHFSIRSRFGDDFFRDRYNIGIWLWETQCFPNEWYDRFVYYDEIWAPTSFIASALSPISPVPVVRVPVVLDPGAPGNRSAGRSRLGIRDDEFVYLFVFNFYSRFQRKNPKAVIDAFKLAFSPDDSARLVIKCANADFAAEYFRELNKLSEGQRITLCDGQWSESEMSDLMAACDCYVSLHRAEGVGLTISDAMAAGKAVVSTGWSGNMDFMDVSNSFPVRFRISLLDADVAHYRAGDSWAEPSIEHAAEVITYIFEHRDEAVRRAENARIHIRRSYSNEAIGALIARRLDLVKKRQRFQVLKQCVGRRITDVPHFVEAFSDLGDYVPEAQFRYEKLKDELRQVVRSHVPPDATLIVVSKGDDALLNLDRCTAWHFPLGKNHQFAGYYPKDSAEAIRELEAVRAKGGGFLLVPKTGFWWLDHYTDFRAHLMNRYRLIHRDESCILFELRAHL